MTDREIEQETNLVHLRFVRDQAWEKAGLSRVDQDRHGADRHMMLAHKINVRIACLLGAR